MPTATVTLLPLVSEPTATVDHGDSHVCCGCPVSDQRNFQSTQCHTQLCSFAIIFSAGVRLRMVCFLGASMTTVILTVAGILNLDFLRYNIFPPMCIASSLKSIHILLFDYVIAFYPLLLTLFVYFIIKLHDRNRLMVNLLTIPFKKFFSFFRKE